MRLLEEKELELIKDEGVLRENISRLEKIETAKRTKAEQDLLEALLDYRQKHCSYPSLAYYSTDEMFYLFD